MARLAKISANLNAFLDMLADSEGTAGKGDDGYNVIVGGGLFDSYADHPRKLVEVRPGLKSTAAGRYQELERNFDTYKKLLGLSDFSPEAQDRIAIQQIREAKAIELIERGDLDTAISRCAHLWASLPGAGYGQPENRPARLYAAYLNAGGTIA